jgi:type I restriction enzyme R subunit
MSLHQEHHFEAEICRHLAEHERLKKTHGTALSTVLAERVRKSLNERGALDQLYEGLRAKSGGAGPRA